MKNKVLKLAIIIFMCVFRGAFAQEKGELTIPFSEPSKKGKVNVDIKRGSIEVSGTDRKDVLLSYAEKVSSKNEKEEMKDGLRRISSTVMDLEVSEKNNLIDIESGSWNQRLDLKIEVPKNVDLHIESYNDGDLLISNINGEIVAENYNGKIAVNNISGSVVADTYNGTITVLFNKITPDTPMAFTTYNGNVDLTLPSDFKGSLKMKTSQGDIYSGFDLAVKKNEPVTKTEKKSGTYRVYLDDWVRGEVNGGGAEFMIKNYNGDIYLRKK